ncbi:LCP family protein [Priestia taiwanensis]|uniref:LytR family transcriptional regulator n=1 Tax=Priestia taiwanensis TaxID=1347902 RepID=A0A917ENK5_9BACI|nr:LCP family protein [Priestia taiwanensis]MBM7363062.1 LCP family protein required for cell wall assembly [Priestia taiwanensis]GGE67311.1 LytR family transcriptional regulator [Priestia taiwanensis]
MKQRKSSRQRRRQMQMGRMIAVVVLVLLLGGVGYGAYIVYKASSTVGDANQTLSRGGKSALRDSEVNPLKDHISVLIMGVDESEKRKEVQGEAVQADALLLATFNQDDKTVKLVSIPRDTYTYIPLTKKMDKINHAHSAGQAKNGKDGGPNVLIDAVEGLLHVPVDFFVKFNFAAFMEIVDEIGGIEVDVPTDITEQNSSDQEGAIRLKKGVQTLNGEEALAFARTRHMDSDAMRGQRQQLVVEAIIKKVASVGSVTKIEGLIDAMDGNFKTNLTFNELISFYKYGMSASIEKLQIAGQDAYINSKKEAIETNQKKRKGYTYYYLPDKKSLDETTRTLLKHLGKDEKYKHRYPQNNEVIKVMPEK